MYRGRCNATVLDMRIRGVSVRRAVCFLETQKLHRPDINCEATVGEGNWEEQNNEDGMTV